MRYTFIVFCIITIIINSIIVWKAVFNDFPRDQEYAC